MDIHSRTAVLTVLLLGTLLPDIAQGNDGEIKIAYKRVNTYDRIWDDSGSGADRDVSIWQPVDIERGFFPLGDAATASHREPSVPSMTVSAVADDALAPPAGFQEVWNDRGSGADDDVHIMHMIPHRGYTCLGHVATRGYNTAPDKNKYRCVKSEYVINSGSYDLIWNDAGSGADTDVSLWANVRLNQDLGIEANTFTAYAATHARPSGRPNLLDHTVAKPRAFVPRSEKVALVVYQTPDIDRIWSDSGSGADADFSSWRSGRALKDHFSLGDVGVRTHSSPGFGFLVKENEPGALVAPISYRRRWTDAGSGADQDVAFYEPICPHHYSALGFVTVSDHNRLPSRDDIRCVKHGYVVEGQWQKVWDDAGSGADRDVSVWRAIPREKGQGVMAMSAVPCHCGMDRRAYVLNPDYIQYIVGRPVKKYILRDIRYHLGDYHILSQEPAVLARTNLINRGPNKQTVTRSIEYTYEESYSWDKTHALEIGVENSVTAGIPELIGSTMTITTTTSFSYTSGKYETTSKTDNVQASVEVAPQSSVVATIMSNRYVVDVPFTATVTPVDTDGKMRPSFTFEGVYEGVQVNDVTVTYDSDVPLSSPSARIQSNIEKQALIQILQKIFGMIENDTPY